VATLAYIGAGAVSAKAQYVATEKPIKDDKGRVQVIIELAKDAHLTYPAQLTVLPRGKSDKSDKAIEYFHHPKVEALADDLERSHGFKRIGMTSWVGKSVTALLTAKQIEKLQADERVVQISEDAASTFSTNPLWNDTMGPEIESWGRKAVNGKVRTVSNGRRVYIIDTGVAEHADLPNVIDRVNVSCGAAACNQYNPSLYPVVGCYAHATHVAGIIGAQANNYTGTKGVYAGVNMVSLSVLTRTGSSNCADSKGDVPTSRSRVGYALDYVYWDTLYNNVQQHVNIVNISINSAGLSFDGTTPQVNWAKARTVLEPDWVWVGCGYQPNCTYEEQFRYYPGAFIAQSAGNLNNDWTCHLDNDAAGRRHYLPYNTSGGAVYADPADGIMVVGAYDKYGSRSTPNFSASIPPGLSSIDEGSNFGTCVDIFAPGDAIYSTWGAMAATAPHPPTLVGTTYWNTAALSGTSMAAPHVAAAAAYYADTYNLTWPGGIEQYIRANTYTLNGQLVFFLP